MLSKQHGNRWKGGRSITSHGYVVIRMPYHQRANGNGYVYEHIVVAEKKLGRPLWPGEIVHHRDENKQNNGEDNITVTESIAAHKVRHRKMRHDLRLPGQENTTIICACGCGGQFLRFDNNGRPRRYLPGHNSKGIMG